MPQDENEGMSRLGIGVTIACGAVSCLAGVLTMRSGYESIGFGLICGGFFLIVWGAAMAYVWWD